MPVTDETRASVTRGHADVLEAKMLRKEAGQIRAAKGSEDEAANLERLAEKIDR